MTAEIGDNSGSIDSDDLRAFVERIEAVNGEIKTLTEDRKSIYAETKEASLSPKIIRRLVKLRAIDQAKRREEEYALQLYCTALGIE